MKLHELARRLQQEGVLDTSTGAIRPEQLRRLALLFRLEPVIGRLLIKAVRDADYRRERFARLKSRKSDKGGMPRIRKPFRPAAGRFTRKPEDTRDPVSMKKLIVYATTSSRRRSGKLKAKLADPHELAALDVSGSMGNHGVQLRFWQTEDGVGHWLQVKQLTPQQFHAQVLGGAYAGDLAEFNFKDISVVLASAPFVHEDIPYSAGLNVVCTLGVPAGFQHLMPQELKLFGPFRANEQVSRSADLRTAPQFAMQVGPLRLEHCHLHVATDLDAEDGAWDTCVYLNGTVNLFGVDLPMTSELSTESGLLSFNLDTDAAPATSLSEFSALQALASVQTLMRPWGDAGQGWFSQFSDYQLTRLNLMYDVATRAPVSLGFRLRFGNPIVLRYQSPVLNVALSDIQFEWLIGLPAERNNISSSGTAKKAVIEQFGNLEWECAIESWPQLCVRLWAPASRLSANAAREWLESVQGTQSVNVQTYSGLLFKLYNDHLEIFIGDEGQDFPRVF